MQERNTTCSVGSQFPVLYLLCSGGLIAVRFFIGVGICIFVCNQFWAGVMFSPNVVGVVNATCGGWGNLGGALGSMHKGLLLLEGL